MKLIIRVLLIQLTLMEACFSLRYTRQLNMDISSSFLINSSEKLSLLRCLISCNLNSDCFNCVYITSGNPGSNCFLFSNYISQSDLILNNNSNLYIKESNYKNYLTSWIYFRHQYCTRFSHDIRKSFTLYNTSSQHLILWTFWCILKSS